MQRICFSLFNLFLISLFSVQVFAEEKLPHFFEVTDGIYRSGRPDQVGLEWAKATIGLRTIVNLENDKKVIASETRISKVLELEHISNPMAWYWNVTDEQVDEIMAVMSDSKNYPLLVHCHYGEDRTGLIIGLYRVLVQKWSPKDAWQEMLDKGFGKVHWKFVNYFKKRTGYNPYQ